MEFGNTKYAYLTLDELRNALRPIYGRHGFSVTDEVIDEDDRGVKVAVEITHAEGWSKRVEGTFPFPKQTNSMNETQVRGGVRTYATRYLLYGLFQIGSEDMPDNDGRTQPRTDERRARQSNAPISDSMPAVKAHLAKLDKAVTDKIITQEQRDRAGEQLKAATTQGDVLAVIEAHNKKLDEKNEEKPSSDRAMKIESFSAALQEAIGRGKIKALDKNHHLEFVKELTDSDELDQYIEDTMNIVETY